MNRKKTLLSLFAIIAISSLAVAQNNPEDASLVGRWTMRSTGGTLVEDLSGKNHFGFLNGASFYKSDPVMVSSVEMVDGSGSVTVPHSTDLEPARGTVETWINVASLHRAEIFYKVSLKTLRTDRRNGVGGAVYGARLMEDGSVVAFVMNDDPNSNNMWTFVESPRPVITPGKWHHIALNWDGKFVRLFIDGVVVNKKSYKEIPGVGLSYSGETEFSLAPGTSFVGQIGETRIYGRPLSDVELTLDATLPAQK